MHAFIWDLGQVHKHFLAQMKAKVHQFRAKLRMIKKGNKNISKHMLRIKAIANSLLAIRGSNLWKRSSGCNSSRITWRIQSHYHDDIKCLVPQGLESQAWFADSGASHHITFLSSNLRHIHSKIYPNEVLVGNGHILIVHSIGSSYLTSSCMPNTNLLLNNILYVPSIIKNLLYVSKFAKDNKSLLRVLC